MIALLGNKQAKIPEPLRILRPGERAPSLSIGQLAQRLMRTG